MPVATLLDFHRYQREAMHVANFENPAAKADTLEYAKEIDLLDDTVRRKRRSSYTAEIQVADRQRDLAFRKLSTVVDIAAQSVDPVEREAGRKLGDIIAAYKADAGSRYTDQTEQMRGLIRGLGEDEPFGWLQTLKATVLATDLEAKNNLFAELFRKRMDEVANRPAAGLNTTEQRKVVNAVWKRIADRANSAAVMNETGVSTGYDPVKLDTFIDKANATIAQFKLILANMGRKQTEEESIDEMITAKSRELVAAQHAAAKAQVERDVWEARQQAEAEAAAERLLAEAAERRAEDRLPQTEDAAEHAIEAAKLAQESAIRATATALSEVGREVADEVGGEAEECACEESPK